MVAAQKYTPEETIVIVYENASHLDKLENDTQTCAEKCKDDICVQKCAESFNAANNYIQGEMSHLKKNLEKCVKDCESNKRTTGYEECAKQCEENNMQLFFGILEGMNKALSSGKPLPKVKH